MAPCKGIKKDGTPCKSPVVLDNGYCRAHQDQASEATAPQEPVRWTRERLEAAIAAHGGPEGLDLSGANLSNLDLSGMDLHGIVLNPRDEESGTQIVANLREVRLEATNLQGASLRGANLQGGYLGKANLQGADLTIANLQGADLENANLQGVCLFAANLQGASLSHAVLQEANLRNINLQGASLWFANLQEANLAGGNLQEANLAGGNLQGADLATANMQGADLDSVNLWEATLMSANLKEANLRYANLRGVDLLHVEKTGGLLGVKFYRAKLDHTALKREQLGPAIGDEQAWWSYREAREAYLALKQNFEDLGNYEAASWAYIKERQMEKACSAPWRARWLYGEEWLGDTYDFQLGRRVHKLPAYHPRVWWFFVRHTRKWLGDWFVEVLCGYGESIGLVLWWMGVLLFASPLLFGLLRLLDWPKANYDVFFDLPVPRRYGYAYLQQFLYLLDAFTTANFAELQPANSLGRLLSGLIALLGIFLTGLLGFVAGNCIRRS